MVGKIKGFGIGSRQLIVTDKAKVLSHPMAALIDDRIDQKLKGNGGGGGDMSDLERRVGSLEADMRIIRDNVHTLATDVAVIKSNYATKTDISDLRTEVSKEIHNQTRWIIGAIFTAISLLFAAQKMFPSVAETKPVQQSIEQAQTSSKN